MTANIDFFEFLIDFGAASVVFDVAEKGRAVFFVKMVVHQKIFVGDLQDVGNETEDGVCYLFVYVAMEFLDFGIMLAHNGRMCPLLFLDELKDVVALPIITQTRKLLNHSERSVAIVVSIF